METSVSNESSLEIIAAKSAALGTLELGYFSFGSSNLSNYKTFEFYVKLQKVLHFTFVIFCPFLHDLAA